MCTMTALKCGAWHCITVFRPNLWELSINFNVNPGKNRKFAKALAFWSRSSMDRIQDSGSYDMGSNPVGITFMTCLPQLLRQACRVFGQQCVLTAFFVTASYNSRE